MYMCCKLERNCLLRDIFAKRQNFVALADSSLELKFYGFNFFFCCYPKQEKINFKEKVEEGICCLCWRIINILWKD